MYWTMGACDYCEYPIENLFKSIYLLEEVEECKSQVKVLKKKIEDCFSKIKEKNGTKVYGNIVYKLNGVCSFMDRGQVVEQILLNTWIPTSEVKAKIDKYEPLQIIRDLSPLWFIQFKLFSEGKYPALSKWKVNLVKHMENLEKMKALTDEQRKLIGKRAVNEEQQKIMLAICSLFKYLLRRNVGWNYSGRDYLFLLQKDDLIYLKKLRDFGIKNPNINIRQDVVDYIEKVSKERDDFINSLFDKYDIEVTRYAYVRFKYDQFEEFINELTEKLNNIKDESVKEIFRKVQLIK